MLHVGHQGNAGTNHNEMLLGTHEVGWTQSQTSPGGEAEEVKTLTHRRRDCTRCGHFGRQPGGGGGGSSNNETWSQHMVQRFLSRVDTRAIGKCVRTETLEPGYPWPPEGPLTDGRVSRTRQSRARKASCTYPCYRTDGRGNFRRLGDGGRLKRTTCDVISFR